MSARKRTHALHARTPLPKEVTEVCAAEIKRKHGERFDAPRSPAHALIVRAKQVNEVALSAAAIEALREIWAHNDELPRNSPIGRVASHDAIKMLSESFGYSISPSSKNALNAIARKLGRKSWGTP